MRKIAVAIFTLVLFNAAHAQSFVNWESPHVHPLDLTPDGTTLLAVNTPDNRLEVFDVTQSVPIHVGSVPVGLEPVSVRARNNNQAWVVNHVSDSVSVVNLNTMNVVRTLATEDEPADIAFAGTPTRAFVSCSQANSVLVYDLADLSAAPSIVEILGEDPRALAVSSDGSQVYAAVFESNNGTTIVGHAGAVEGSARFNPINGQDSPYGGQNPPPNDGAGFTPPINPALPDSPPKVSLIVRKTADGQWLDDNDADWTPWVSGGAEGSRRPVGWDLVDNDVAIIDAATLVVDYVPRLMNIVMAIAVNPGNNRITVVGTEATNEIRFEPNLQGRFVRVEFAQVRPDNMATQLVDLNPHLDYSDAQVAQQHDPATASQELRDLSIGDPRALVWLASGRSGFVAGMGSNNLVRINRNGNRLGDPIEVGEGPTGLALLESKKRLFVLNKFEASISVVHTGANQEITRVSFYDPTPPAIKTGRKHLYSTHDTSGLGQVACGSCHVDARIDRLAWDLGDPTGEMTSLDGINCNAGVLTNGCTPFHPMKGPMTTQTLQDIIGHEPHHWRGDKKGLEDFNGAFRALQGDDEELTPSEMQEFEDFLATTFFPPNPFRNFDNSLPTDLALPGHYSSGEFEPEGGLSQGDQLLNGDAVAGMTGFRFEASHSSGGVPSRTCISCHTFPTGMGTDMVFVGNTSLFPDPGSGQYEPIDPGPNGESHLATTGLRQGGTVLKTWKIPHLRNIYDKMGFQRDAMQSLSGFGVFNAGTETLAGFMHEFRIWPASDQDVADVVAFLLSFAGGDLPQPDPNNLLEPPGPAGQDVHAAVGKQVTFQAADVDAAGDARLAEMIAIADAGAVGLVVKGIHGGEQRGYAYVGGNSFQSDRLAELVTAEALRQSAGSGMQLTYSVVPLGSEVRIGLDRDDDGHFDRDELDVCADPADPLSTPANSSC